MKNQLVFGLVVAFVYSSILTGQDNSGTEGVAANDRSPWKLVDVETKASLRGLHVFSPNDIWASGSGGTIINSSDGGKTWRVRIVPGAEELDFRDIHAIDDQTVVAITSGTPARIYRTHDGGSNWRLCFENKDEQVFLDALSFWDDKNGIVMGDPIDGSLFLLKTSDGGKTWNNLDRAPASLLGEGGFAASGTNMIRLGESRVFIGLGGAENDSTKETSRILVTRNRGSKWTAANVPMKRNASSGIFSICFSSPTKGVAVGGDYKMPDDTSSNYATTNDGGETWSTPPVRQPPSGFRSCVAGWVDGNDHYFVTVGTNGTDVSGDLGKSWQRVSDEGFHAIDFAPGGQHGWATGGDGSVAKWMGTKKAVGGK